MKFLKENWIWIAAPVVLFALAVVAVVVFGGDGQSPNEYDLR